MGLFKKIFRKKKTGSDEQQQRPIADPSFPSAAQSQAYSRGASANGSYSNNNSNSLSINPMFNYNEYGGVASPNSDFISPRSSTGPVDTDDEGIIKVQDVEDVEAYYREVRNKTQEELREAYERSRSPQNSTSNIAGNNRNNNSNNNNNNTSNSMSTEDSSLSSPRQRLTTNKLHQWTTQQNNNSSASSSSPPYQQTNQNKQQPIYSMASGLPMQMHNDDMDRSQSSASSFNLSTDAEDSEYEGLKRLSSLPLSNMYGMGALSALDTSAIDTVGSVTSYTTDEDRKIFPNLPTDDEMTLGTEASAPNAPPSLLLEMPLPKAHHHASIVDEPWKDHDYEFAPNTNSISRNKPGGTPRDFTSPRSAASSTTSASPTKDNLPRRNNNTTNNNNNNKNNINNNNNSSLDDGFGTLPTISTTTTNTSPAKKAIATLNNMKKTTRSSPFGDFDNFADFSNFADGSAVVEWPTHEEKKDTWEDHSPNDAFPKSSSPRNNINNNVVVVDDDDTAWKVAPDNNNNHQKEDPFRAASYVSAESSSTGFAADRSLTELLEAAKSKRTTNSVTKQLNLRTSYGGGNRLSSSSVNSAPTMTASYLRQHHNLDSNNHKSPKGGEGTSVSDIIESLEATDRMKQQQQMSSHRSMGDAGVVATARAAKERLRDRRRKESSTAAANDHSDESPPDASESWLFDQVTGAMGPVGIAADLESLSGRSTRSKNSHSRAKRSSSSRRRYNRSDRSVDSHGSRYSHRSTKSFLSQMSEQSRSVANDLLRLEMQLAMVGNSNNNNNNNSGGTNNAAIDALPVVQSARATMGSSSNASLASRNSSRSRSKYSSSNNNNNNNNTNSAPIRRTKATIVAPPGKLGIILANKADSKGTVVSGVRTSSVLVNKISPGDRIVAIDGEDVSRMTVSEITTIMSRKSEYERKLTVLVIPSTTTTSSSSAAAYSSSYRR